MCIIIFLLLLSRLGRTGRGDSIADSSSPTLHSLLRFGNPLIFNHPALTFQKILI
jgi:hypothetical protein